jgi:hypothetical protein
MRYFLKDSVGNKHLEYYYCLSNFGTPKHEMKKGLTEIYDQVSIYLKKTISS